MTNTSLANESPKLSPRPETLRRPPSSGGLPWQLRLAIFAGLIIGAPFLFTTPVGQRGLLALVWFGLLGMLLVFSPRVGVSGLLVFLCVVGGMRRWLIPLLGWTSTDPLVLVAPAIAVLCLLNLLATRLLPRDTRLSRLLLWLLALMTLEILNPMQGGISVGLAGILFYMVPILWYYLGRKYVSAALLERVFQVAIGVAVLASMYGLYQTWFGFLPSELEWMRLSGMGALSVNGTTRALSFFTSPQEYGGFVGLAIVLLWVFCVRGNRAALIPIPLLALALFLESSRGAIVGTLAACTAVWAIQGRSLNSWIPRGILALVIAVVGLVWTLQQAQNASFSTQTQALVDHQTQGLLDPANAKTSTAGIHSAMVGNGILEGFKNPVGRGLGATTIAAGKFDGTNGGSTEMDISNMFASLGFIGGFLYAGIIGMALFKAFRFWHLTRTTAALCILAVLLLNVGQWINGQLYAAVFIIWVSIGVLDRMQADWVRTPRVSRAE